MSGSPSSSYSSFRRRSKNYPSAAPQDRDTPESRRYRNIQGSVDSIGETDDLLGTAEKAAKAAHLEAVDEPPAPTEDSWHHVPLAFALIPPVFGFVFGGRAGGGDVWTDFMLMAIVAMYLRYLVKFPWEWYKAAGARKVIELQRSDALNDDGVRTTTSSPSESGIDEEERLSPMTRRDEAIDQLEMMENIALLSCFAGPLVGGLLLHWIRTALSRSSEGMVSNFNITLFVLAAEMRPMSQAMKLLERKTLHLQTLVHQPPAGRVTRLIGQVEDLQKSLREVSATVSAFESEKLVADAREGVRPDLEAVQRAVRRYEKKEAMHRAHAEERIAAIERKMDDVMEVILKSEKTMTRQWSTIGVLFGYIRQLALLPLMLTLSLLSLPYRAVHGGVRMITGAGRKGHGRRLLRASEHEYEIGDTGTRVSRRS
ncbi:hypothetical protein G7K_4269-t1 [Saitoella complicata NRRL Y-17804]|uniref:Uncharacterized protein n=2 Tax=Saitoella complicata (strain BCRC 22490 / CBS 7301 / JCM 7358 / NBRC 10748 / NRRL Y-17804) TaxID=698492 RepID=A0A0E9NJW3_SAICN|nr:hypothetical protein G7K_4269-t1 [Saitoella complicata NRRL Y-17804]